MSRVFVVKPRNQSADQKVQSRLIKAERRAQVESMLIGEFSIEPAEAEECVALGADGVKVEDATTTAA